MQKRMFMFSKSIKLVVLSLLVFSIVMPAGIVNANSPVYTITVDPPVINGLTLNLTGTGSANPYAGQFSQHHVSVNWGDNTIDPTSNENFTEGPGKTFTGTWANSHIYAAPGTYTIIATLYHGQQGGAESSGASVTLVDVVIPPPPINDDPFLTVTKVVTNDDGGTLQAGDFELFVDGNPVDSGVQIQVGVGAHIVSETNEPGYAFTGFGGDCDANGNVTLADGETKECLIMNDDIAPRLTVIKEVVGGPNPPGDFVLSVQEIAPTPGQPINVLNGIETELPEAGVYQISEENLPGYTATFTGQCNPQGVAMLAVGDVKTCTITNTFTPPEDEDEPKENICHATGNGGFVVLEVPVGDPVHMGHPDDIIPITDMDQDGDIDEDDCLTPPPNDEAGTLIVIKHVINDEMPNPGTKVAADFQMQVTGAIQSNFPGEEAPGTILAVPAGVPYNVDEGDHTGYTKTRSADCDGTLLPNEVKICTITNDDRPQNDVPPPPPPGDDENDENLITICHKEQNGSFNVILVDEQTHVDQNNEDHDLHTPDDIIPIGDENQDGQITAADCGQGTLTVIKHVNNNGIGSAAASHFTMNVTGTNVSNPSFQGSEVGITVTLNAGPYNVDEADSMGYAKSLSPECAGNIAAGQAITCTITNTMTGDTPPPGGGGGNNGGGGGGNNGGGGFTPPGGSGSDPDVELSEDVCETNKFKDYKDKVATWLTCEGIAHGLADNDEIYTKNERMNRLHFYKLLARSAKMVNTPHKLGSDVVQYYDVLKNAGLPVININDNISGENASELIKLASHKVVNLSSDLTRVEAASKLFDLFATPEYK